MCYKILFVAITLIVLIHTCLLSLCDARHVNDGNCGDNETSCATGQSDNGLLLNSVSKLVNLVNQGNYSVQMFNDTWNNETNLLDNLLDVSSMPKFSMDALKPIEHKLKQTFLQLLTSLNLSQECQLSIFKIINSIEHGEFWPMACKLI